MLYFVAYVICALTNFRKYVIHRYGAISLQPLNSLRWTTSDHMTNRKILFRLKIIRKPREFSPSLSSALFIDKPSCGSFFLEIPALCDFQETEHQITCKHVQSYAKTSSKWRVLRSFLVKTTCCKNKRTGRYHSPRYRSRDNPTILGRFTAFSYWELSTKTSRSFSCFFPDPKPKIIWLSGSHCLLKIYHYKNNVRWSEGELRGKSSWLANSLCKDEGGWPRG